MVGLAGCRDSGTLTPADLSMAGGGGGGGGGGGAGGGDLATGMKNYMTSTIAAMRMGAPGDYELDNVVAIAVTPSGSHLVAQDAAGTDFSAIKTNCSSTSPSHPCSVGSTVKTVAVGHNVTIKGTFIKSKETSGGTEDFYIDSITDNGAGTLPTPATVTLADVQQSSVAMATTAAPTNKKYWFQHVTVTAPGTLNMYDPAPAPFKYTGGTGGCPAQFGWGVAPSGTSGANATLSCDASCSMNPPGAACTQPAGVALNGAEVLIGTDFYSGFTKSTDCKCYSKYSDTAPGSSTSKLGGILMYDTVYMSSPVQAYIYLAPLDDTTDVTF
ncbi:MAG TPA: hypothetical protein VHB97_06075 [Polyangia bacterium]|nr:hypothetical protein [Polyangia bacterium]